MWGKARQEVALESQPRLTEPGCLNWGPPLVGAAVFLAISATAVSFAQAAPLALVALAAVGVSELGVDGAHREIWPPSAPAVAVVVLGFFAGFSALWAPRPSLALVKGGALATVALVATMAGCVLARADPERRRELSNGLVMGLALGLLFVAVNALTSDYLTRWCLWRVPLAAASIAKHVNFGPDGVISVSASVGNRPMAVATLLLFPGWLVARSHASRAITFVFLGCSALFVLAVFLRGNHQSSQLALVAGAIVFLLSWSRPMLARRFIMTVWTAMVLTVPLLAAGIYKADLHDADWLFSTARARVVIWGTTAARIEERPFLGHGAAATEVLQKTQPPPERRDGERYHRTTARHAHNVYLQVWFELGAAGAVLLCGLGLLALQAIGRLPSAEQPAMLALFAVCATMMSSSYGIWQLWIQASLGLAAGIALAVSGRAGAQVVATGP